MRIPDERMSTIYSAPDPAFTSVRATIPPRSGRFWIAIRFTYPYILYAGTIRLQKNVPRLVEAFAVLRVTSWKITRFIAICAW